MIFSFIGMVFLVWVLSRIWAYYIEHHPDLIKIRLLEPWYWFLFLNFLLIPVSGNYDPEFVGVGLFIQVALGVWFAVSIGWIIGSCPHKTAYYRQSPYHKEVRTRCCYRCGTPLGPQDEATLVENKDWKVLFFQVPPSLLEYVTFWVAQSLLVLISLFLALRVIHNPDPRHRLIVGVIILIVLVPPAIYFWGRFRGYLRENQGMIWWEDLRSSFLTWAMALAFLWILFHFWVSGTF